MPNRNKLSIYLIKQEFSADDSMILDSNRELLASIPHVGNVYFRPSRSNPPTWVRSFFGETVDATDIFSANARAVLICRISVQENGIDTQKAFAVTMGYGKSMLAENVIEDDFGLKVVLNTIKSDSLRKINKVNIGGNQKASNEQLPLKSEIDDFGFDIDRDLIGTITGYSDDELYVTGMMSGGELLSVTAEVDVSNILDFLKKTYTRYTQTNYRTNFGWVDHIKKVKDSRTIDALDEEAVRLINAGSPSIWMAVPDVINWEDIAGFRYNGETLYDDIYIEAVKDSFRHGFDHIEQLKNGRRITAISAVDGHSAYTTWSAYKCLCGELEHQGKSYCINNGRWFCIDNDFVAQVNRDYDSIPVSEMSFIDFTNAHQSENEYSTKFAETNPGHLLCMDRKTITYGGGHSKIELCDILTNDGTYIHVKPYSGSATLSHLFNQAVVSAELVLWDSEFRSKANQEIDSNTDNHDFRINNNTKPNVILAIISKFENDRPPIPFFSKVALRYTKRRLEIAGCSISIKNIKNLKQPVAPENIDR